MKKLDYPVSIEQLAFRNVEIAHFQSAYFEGFAGIMSAYATTSPDQGFKISGCEVSVVGSTYTCTAGVICLKGEIFNVPETSVELPAFHEIYFDVVQSAVQTESAAPNRDGGTYNTRLERVVKLVINADPPAVRMPINAKTLDQILFEKTNPVGKIWFFDPRFEGKVMSDFFNMETGVGLENTLYRGCIILGVYPGTGVYKGRVIMNMNADDIDFNSVGKIYGSKEHTLTNAQIPVNRIGGKNTALPGYAVGSNPVFTSGGPDDPDNPTVLHKSIGGGQSHNNMQPSIVAAYITRYHPAMNLS